MADKLVCKRKGNELMTFLKLPKAHNWILYEFFYSNIDRALLLGRGEFISCVKSSFPGYDHQKLCRAQWSIIRKTLGKPRRFSDTFLKEEREELAIQREKVRRLQQRRSIDFDYKDLPDEIPIQLVVGTKVTARYKRRPIHDGIYTGTVEGVDPADTTYRITFDRPGVGTHSIPDYEVMADGPVDTFMVSGYALKVPRRLNYKGQGINLNLPGLLGSQPDGLLYGSNISADGRLGGFPIRFLVMIIRFSKLLRAKSNKINSLKELNVEGEKMLSYGYPYKSDYKMRYARCVLDLLLINEEETKFIDEIRPYVLQVVNDHSSPMSPTIKLINSEEIQDSANKEAMLLVNTYNFRWNRTVIRSQKILEMIRLLISILLQVRVLAGLNPAKFELKKLVDTIKAIRASLSGKNLLLFQTKVEIPMNRIMEGMCKH